MSLFDIFKTHKTKLDENSMKYGVALITASEPHSAIAEQYRTIRTNIQFSFISKIFKTLAFTSSNPSEGKSTVSANMAVSWAEEGKKVLLVDADLRRTTMHRTFNVPNNKGLTTIITSQQSVDLNAVVHPTFIKNLSVLTSGPMPPNPAELLGSKRMSELLHFLSDHYDLIILDIPPVNTVTDAQVISSKVDGVIMVIPQGIANKDAVLRACALLRHVDANIIGAIMNRVTAKESGGYYGGYYGDYYGGYYGTSDKKRDQQ